MSTAIEEVSHENAPPIWELVRTFSGVVIVVGVVVALAVSAVLSDRSTAGQATVDQASATMPVRSDRIYEGPKPFYFFVTSEADAERLKEHLETTKTEVANLGMPVADYSYKIVLLEYP
jgi:hypothetical protein